MCVIINGMEDNAEKTVARRTWYVLHVKPRTEKKVEEYLACYKCFHYLPLYVKVRKVQRRQVRTTLPLFPGYVFTRLSADERREMMRTNLLVHLIEVPFPRTMVHQLRQISRAARNLGELPSLVAAPAFRGGEYVRITSGPFMGTEGQVERVGARGRVHLNIDILNQSIEIEIPVGDLEPIEKQTEKGER